MDCGLRTPQCPRKSFAMASPRRSERKRALFPSDSPQSSNLGDMSPISSVGNYSPPLPSPWSTPSKDNEVPASPGMKHSLEMEHINRVLSSAQMSSNHSARRSNRIIQRKDTKDLLAILESPVSSPGADGVNAPVKSSDNHGRSPLMNGISRLSPEKNGLNPGSFYGNSNYDHSQFSKRNESKALARTQLFFDCRIDNKKRARSSGSAKNRHESKKPKKEVFTGVYHSIKKPKPSKAQKPEKIKRQTGLRALLKNNFDFSRTPFNVKKPSEWEYPKLQRRNGTALQPTKLLARQKHSFRKSPESSAEEGVFSEFPTPPPTSKKRRLLNPTNLDYCDNAAVVNDQQFADDFVLQLDEDTEQALPKPEILNITESTSFLAISDHITTGGGDVSSSIDCMEHDQHAEVNGNVVSHAAKSSVAASTAKAFLASSATMPSSPNFSVERIDCAQPIEVNTVVVSPAAKPRPEFSMESMDYVQHAEVNTVVVSPTAPVISKRGKFYLECMAYDQQAEVNRSVMSPAPKVPVVSPTAKTSAVVCHKTKENVGSPRKMFPIFQKSYSPTFKDLTNMSRGSAAAKKWRPLGDDQYQLDAGQNRFGATGCSHCGLVFQLGDPDDELQHDKYHSNFEALRHTPWKSERKVGDFGNEHVVLVQSGDSRTWLSRAQAVVDFVDKELGFQHDGWQNHTNFKFYLYVSKNVIVGCCAAEPTQKAYRMIVANDGIDTCSESSFPVSCGISRVWVLNSHRRKGIATRLIDSCRSNFMFGKILSKEDIAFSVPTADGKEFAKKYMGREDYLVYTGW